MYRLKLVNLNLLKKIIKNKNKSKNKNKKNLHTTTKSTIIGKSQFITKNELVFHYNFFLSI